MRSFFTLLGIPLIFLNLFGSVVAGVWLAVLGQWWAIIYGIIGFLFSHYLISIVLAPSLALVAPATIMIENKRQFSATILLALNSIYTYGIISSWCVFVFFIFMNRAMPSSFIPIAIWSYGVATGPLAFMARHESQSASSFDSSSFAVLFAQIAYIIVCIVTIFFRTDIFDLYILFAGVMGIALLINLVMITYQLFTTEI